MRNLKLKFRRIELDMSQTELAKKCGVTLNDIFWEEEEPSDANEV